MNHIKTLWGKNGQNRAARIILNMRNDAFHSVALQALGWKGRKPRQK